MGLKRADRPGSWADGLGSQVGLQNDGPGPSPSPGAWARVQTGLNRLVSRQAAGYFYTSSDTLDCLQIWS